MQRILLMSVLSLALSVSAGDCFAQGGFLARLNKSIVPGMPTVPGVPTASPLGLIAPRLSNAVSIFQLGGMATQAGRLSFLGLISPRLSPIVAMLRTPAASPQLRSTYLLTLISPRATSLVGMMKGFRGMAGSMRGSVGGMAGMAPRLR